jgi:hypothetical protein
MTVSMWTDADTAKALQFWAEYQRTHDVSNQKGKTAGIDPVSGQVWFGESIVDVGRQLDAAGISRPLYFVRVGSDHYYRKGGRR